MSEFKVGDRVWFLSEGSPRAGVVTKLYNDNDCNGCLVRPHYNAGLSDVYCMTDYDVFHRPEESKKVIEAVKKRIWCLNYDLDEFSDACRMSMYINFNDFNVLENNKGEGKVVCKKCKTEFEFSVYTETNIVWDEEMGEKKINCPNCGEKD